MGEIWTMGEILVEIMRPRTEMPFHEIGEFIGPLPSGAPAIFIDTVARLGHKAGIIGGVGTDGFGHVLLDRLRSDGVNCNFILMTKQGSTAVAFVTYFKDGSRQYIFHIEGTPAVKAKAINDKKVPKTDFFHIMGCSLMVNKEFYHEIIKSAEIFWKRGAEITFDPNIRKELLKGEDIHEIIDPIMKRSSILFPGEEELRLITGQKEINHCVEDLFEIPSMKMIVLKKGRQGCTVFTKDGIINIPAFDVDEVDPTGAGDCFDAGFLCALAEGKPLYDCGRVAAASGALNASAFGPMEGKISSHSIDALIKKNIYHENGSSNT